MAIGWEIIGIGNHADRSIAPAIRKAANAELVAVCSRAVDRAGAFARKHNSKRYYDSFEEMLRNPEVQAVFAKR